MSTRLINMNKDFKKTLQIANNILLYVVSILLLLSVWLELTIFHFATISMAVLSLIISVISKDEIKPKFIFSDMNLYYFLVTIIIAISKVINSNKLFYVGIGLFAIVLVLYIIFTFIINQDKKKDNK